MIREAKANLAKAQNRMNVLSDKKHVERKFEMGDWVFLKLHPYRQQTVAQRRTRNLLPNTTIPTKL